MGSEGFLWDWVTWEDSVTKGGMDGLGVIRSVIGITYCNLRWPLDWGGGGLNHDATCDFAVAFGSGSATICKHLSPLLLVSRRVAWTQCLCRGADALNEWAP